MALLGRMAGSRARKVSFTGDLGKTSNWLAWLFESRFDGVECRAVGEIRSDGFTFGAQP